MTGMTMTTRIMAIRTITTTITIMATDTAGMGITMHPPISGARFSSASR